MEAILDFVFGSPRRNTSERAESPKLSRRSVSPSTTPSRRSTGLRRTTEKIRFVQWRNRTEQTRIVIAHFFRKSANRKTYVKYHYVLDRHIGTIIQRYSDWVRYPEGNAVFSGHSTLIKVALVTNNGEHLFTASTDGSIIKWNLETNEREKHWRAHSHWILCLAHDRAHLVASGARDKKVHLWDTISCALVRTLEGHTDDVSCVAFGRDSTLLSGSNDHTLRLWNVENGECLKIFDQHRYGVRHLSLMMVPEHSDDYSSDYLMIGTSSTLSSSSEDMSIESEKRSTFISAAYNELKQWDLSSGLCLRSMSNVSINNSIRRLRFNADASLLGVNCLDGITVFKWPSMTRVQRVNHPAYSAVFHPLLPNLMILGCRDNLIRVFDMNMSMNANDDDDDEQQQSVDENNHNCIHIFRGNESPLMDVCFTPDGSRLISVSSYKKIRIWDFTSFL